MELISKPYLYQHLSFLEIDRKFSHHKAKLAGLPQYVHHKEILQDRLFRNYLDDQLWMFNNFKEHFDKIESRIKSILKEVRN